MPIYEYECNACHSHLEVTQSIKEAPLKTCQQCGKDELQKLISRSAFHLKGGGWYSDLYASSTKDAKKDAPAAATPAAASSDSGTSSAAPASTPSTPSSTTSGTTEKKAEGRTVAA